MRPSFATSSIVCRAVLACGSVYCFAATVFAGEPVAIPVSGAPFSATLSSIRANGDILLNVGGKLKATKPNELFAWGARTDSKQGPFVVLADGSILKIRLRSLASGKLVCESAWFGELTLPLEKLRGIVFHPGGDALERDRLLERVQNNQQTFDEILLEGGDSLSGSVLEWSEREPQMTFEGKGTKRSVPRERVVAILANASLAERPPSATVLQLGLRDGSFLSVRSLREGKALERIVLGCQVELPIEEDAERFWRRVNFVSNRIEEMAFLSELTPLSYKHVAYLSTEWPYQMNRNVLGGRLRVNGALFEKGLGMHSNSRLAFAVPAGYRFFRAEAALDDSAEPLGSVAFRVYLAEGEGKWRLAFDSGLRRFGDPIADVNVELGETHGLALIIDSADGGTVLDRANWLNARFIK